MHDVAVAQDTPFRLVSTDPLGTGSVSFTHDPPAQSSANATWPLLVGEPFEKPTAMHIVNDGHDTPASAA